MHLSAELASAEVYHAMLRSSDLVQGAMLHNFSYFVNPVGAHSEPPNPRSHISALFASFAGSRVLPAEVNSPRYSVTADIPQITSSLYPLTDWNTVDALALLAPDGAIHLCILNRDLSFAHHAEIRLRGLPPGEAVFQTVRYESTASPFTSYYWSNEDSPVFRTIDGTVTATDGTLTLPIPAASFIHLTLPAAP